MLLLTVVIADQIRAITPCSLLSLSMVPFATVSLGIGAISWIMPRRVTQLKLYGDIEKLKESPDCALVLANHQSDVDWVVLVMLAQRQGRYGNDAGFRVMVKHIIHYIPLFGWYIFQHGYVYVRRFGEFLYGPVLKQLSWLDSLGEPFWLLVFPEGTRYSLKKKEALLASQEFCRRKRIPELTNVLCPRVGGIFLAVERLDSLDAVYDVTIAYGQTRLPNRRGVAPSMLEFVCGEQAAKVLNVHVKRYSAKELRKSRKELQDWIMKAYSEKDRLLEDYYKTGEFPEPVSLDEQSVSICRTLPPTLFFVAALVAPYYVPAVRNAYLLTLASSPFLIFWLEATKCV